MTEKLEDLFFFSCRLRFDRISEQVNLPQVQTTKHNKKTESDIYSENNKKNTLVYQFKYYIKSELLSTTQVNTHSFSRINILNNIDPFPSDIYNIKRQLNDMQIDDSCVSFQSSYGQKRRLTKDRNSVGMFEADIAMLEQCNKGIWSAIEKVREVNVTLKREVQVFAEGLREEFKQKAKTKTQRIEAILATVDAKVLFIVYSCDRSIKQLSEQFSHHFQTHTKDEEDRQVILRTCNQMSERVRVLEQKIFSHRHLEEQFRRQIEALTQQNQSLTQELNIVMAKSGQRIQQLQMQLRQKVDELRRKQVDLIRREDNLRKEHQQQQEQQEHGRPRCNQPSLIPQNVSNGFVPPTTFQNPLSIQVTAQTTQATQQKPMPQPVNHVMPSQPKPKVITSQQEVFKPSTAYKPITAYPGKIAAHLQQPPDEISLSVSQNCVTTHQNNTIEIKPQFFKTSLESQVSEYSEVVECRGIFLKSLNKDEPANGINVRKLKESSDSGSLQRRYSKKDQNHRFDYLISNLAATQGESTQIFEGYNDSVISAEPSMFQTPNRR